MNFRLGPDLDDNTEIARYVSFPAFLYMLQFGKAFIPSIANLQAAPGNHGDPTEGRWSPVDEFLRDGSAEILDILANGIWPSADRKGLQPNAQPTPPSVRPVLTPFGTRTIPVASDNLKILNRKQCSWIDAWCWHKFEHEHIGMWRQYGAGEGAVCIRTSIGHLRAATRLQANERAYIGSMHYTDRRTGIPDVHAEFSLFLQKLHAYQYEEEVRVLVFDPASPIDEERPVPGRYVALDTQALMREVIVHPDAPEWMFELITSILEAKMQRGAARSDIFYARNPDA